MCNKAWTFVRWEVSFVITEGVSLLLTRGIPQKHFLPCIFIINYASRCGYFENKSIQQLHSLNSFSWSFFSRLVFFHPQRPYIFVPFVSSWSSLIYHCFVQSPCFGWNTNAQQGVWEQMRKYHEKHGGKRWNSVTEMARLE